MNFFASRFGKQESTACDAGVPPMPINGSKTPQHTLLNVPTGSGKTAAKVVQQQSLEKHDRQFHHGHYDGGKCKYREQNGIKTGSAGAVGTGTATPTTTSPAPSSNPITIQEKSEIREEDTLSKNFGENTMPPTRQRGFGTPGSYVDTGMPWKPKNESFVPDLPKIPRGATEGFQPADSFRPNDGRVQVWKPQTNKSDEEMIKWVTPTAPRLPSRKWIPTIGGPGGHWREKSDSELWNEWMSYSNKTEKAFLEAVGMNAEACNAILDALGPFETRAQWLRKVMNELNIRPHYGRFSQKDVQRIIDYAKKKSSEFLLDGELSESAQQAIKELRKQAASFSTKQTPQQKQEGFVQGAISNSFGKANAQGVKDRATVETSEDGDSVFFTAHSKEDADKFVAALKAEADRTGREVNVMTGWDDDADDENGHRQIQIEIVGRGEENPGNPPMTKSVGSPTASKPWWMPRNMPPLPDEHDADSGDDDRDSLERDIDDLIRNG